MYHPRHAHPDLSDGDVDWHALHEVPARLLRYAAEVVRAERTRQIEDAEDMEFLGLRG